MNDTAFKFRNDSKNAEGVAILPVPRGAFASDQLYPSCDMIRGITPSESEHAIRNLLDEAVPSAGNREARHLPRPVARHRLPCSTIQASTAEDLSQMGEEGSPLPTNRYGEGRGRELRQPTGATLHPMRNEVQGRALAKTSLRRTLKPPSRVSAPYVPVTQTSPASPAVTLRVQPQHVPGHGEIKQSGLWYILRGSKCA